MKYLNVHKNWQLITLLFVLITSCMNMSVKNNLRLSLINIDPTVSQDFKLSDIFSKIEYITLESNSGSYIEKIKSMKIYGELIFINDGNHIFQYNTNGDFLNKIGNKGKGPGEFLNLKDFNVNLDENMIEILDLNGKKVIYYSLDGSLLEEWDIGLYAYDYCRLPDFKYMFYSGYEQNGNKSFSINLLEKGSNRIIDSQFSIDENMAWYYYLMQDRHFYRLQDSIFCLRDPFDTIYCVNKNNRLVPSRVLNFGKYKLPDSFIYHKHDDIILFGDEADKQTYVHHVNHFIENISYVFFTYRFKGDIYQAFYNKKTKMTLVANNVINDLTLNGLESDFNYQYVPRAYDNKAFYYIIEPYLFIEQMEKVKNKCSETEWEEYLQANPNIKKYFQNISLDDNPILGVYYLND